MFWFSKDEKAKPTIHEIEVPKELHGEAAEIADMCNTNEFYGEYQVQLLAEKLGGDRRLRWKLRHFINRYGFVLAAKEYVE